MLNESQSSSVTLLFTCIAFSFSAELHTHTNLSKKSFAFCLISPW
uniref:Uncharacterized protein n=1 Tax=Anguilla anguilla TaxID=7936 RepID=A0A0E9QWN8_ANGAN